ncbi:unnamed protein product [Boreogadus saida]
MMANVIESEGDPRDHDRPRPTTAATPPDDPALEIINHKHSVLLHAPACPPRPCTNSALGKHSNSNSNSVNTGAPPHLGPASPALAPAQTAVVSQTAHHWRKENKKEEEPDSFM